MSNSKERNSSKPSRHGPGSMLPNEKAANFGPTIKKILKHLAPFKLKLSLVIIMCILANVFSIISPKLLGQGTDIVVRSVSQGNPLDFGSLKQILLVLICLYLLTLVSSILEGWISSSVAMEFTYNLRQAMSEKIDKLPLSYFDKETKGEVQSRFINDVEIISQTLSQSMSEILYSIVTVIGAIGMMLWINPLLTLIVFLSLPLSMFLIKVVISFSQRYFTKQQELIGKANGKIEEVYSGHMVFKAFNGEPEAISSFNETNEALRQTGWRSQFVSSIMQPLSALVGNLTYVIVCLLGGYMVIKGKVTIGSIQAFIQYIRAFNRPIAVLANIANILQSTAAAGERVFEFLEEYEEHWTLEKNKAEDYIGIGIEKALGSQDNIISFQNISFGYGDITVIEDFSFDIKKGEKIAIVGPTGAGKTTLVKLLMGFYPLKSGKILLNGQDIRTISKEDLRRNMAMVLQDAWLFTGTIKENIGYGSLSSGEDDIIHIEEAAKAAHAHHFITCLPKQYETMVASQGDKISQGQKQLLTIARAVLANSPILILDEATSSVDTRTEFLIQKAMDSLIVGRTSLIIAHRLSTIRNADKILVMNEGNIIEQGTHDELIKAKGFYYDLYRSQF